MKRRAGNRSYVGHEVQNIEFFLCYFWLILENSAGNIHLLTTIITRYYKHNNMKNYSKIK